MGLDRSAIQKPNVQANLNASKQGSKFVKVDENSTLRVRFLPTTHPEGLLTYTTTSHFKLKEEADDGGVKGMALACLNDHGEEPCYICDLIKGLNKSGDKAGMKIAKQLRGSTRYNYQVLVAEKQNDNTWKYGKPCILGLPKGASEDLAQLLANMELMGQPDFADVNAGQDILISRTGTGLSTKYRIDRSGEIVDLDEVYPKWDEDFMDDMWDALNLRVFTRELMQRAARFTFSELIDWETMADEYGL
jgi:hypothetical protein